MNNAIILLDPREGCVDGVGALPGAGPGHLELELQAKICEEFTITEKDSTKANVKLGCRCKGRRGQAG